MAEMKLIDIITKHVSEWPDDVYGFTQDSNGEVYSCTHRAIHFEFGRWVMNDVRYPGRTFLEKVITTNPAEDHHKTIVTKEMWEKVRRMKTVFTKDMLEDGMRVKTRCETMCIKIGDTLRTMTGYIPMSQYTDDLRNTVSDKYDIMEVYADAPYCCDLSAHGREDQTEQQKRILELEETIRKAQEQIRELMEEELYSTTIM